MGEWGLRCLAEGGGKTVGWRPWRHSVEDGDSKVATVMEDGDNKAALRHEKRVATKKRNKRRRKKKKRIRKEE